MQPKVLLNLAFVAAAMAQGGFLSELSSLTSAVGSLTLALPTEDFSVLSVLETAVPESLRDSLTDPAVASSFASEIDAGNTPAWYSNLPADVKSYIENAAGITSNLPLSSVASELTAGVSSVRSSIDSAVSEASSIAASASRAVGAASTSSDNGAAVPTGALLASMAGAAGVLALAVGL